MWVVLERNFLAAFQFCLFERSLNMEPSVIHAFWDELYCHIKTLICSFLSLLGMLHGKNKRVTNAIVKKFADVEKAKDNCNTHL